MTPDILILGCGYAGRALARLARSRGLCVRATVRSEERAAALRADGFDVLQSPALGAEIATQLDGHTHVAVCFQPDQATDARVAPALSAARAITYVSSTGVYGDRRGTIDDATPVPAPNARAAPILAAEARYREVGATVLRCPGIYGPDRGLHTRVIRGQHRIPGDGSRASSRIHVDDLAALILAASAVRGETFVVGDLAPGPQIEVIRFVCEAYGVALPESVPIEQVHASLQADRRVDPSRALTVLGVSLQYPSYRDGMAPAATSLRT
jgi:nucleoside-diphosphate-sugar epimerase